MDPLQPGDPSRVGGYDLVGRLGRGGSGRVFLGHTPSGRAVAVKVLHADFAGQEELRARFATEVRAAMKVSAFYTAPVVDADPDAHPPWLVTAYIPGLTLGRAVVDNGPLPTGAVRTLGAHLAEGLAAIHDSGLVHRDLKPGNILLATDGARIIDFGIALAADSTRHTLQGAIGLGTPAYMSPEQIRGDADVDRRTDVFSLGGVLAFAATGRGAFGTGTPDVLFYRTCHQEPDLDALPPALREIIARCLAKDPADRPTTRQILQWLSRPRPLLGSSGRPGAFADPLIRRPGASPLPANLPPHPPARPPAHPPAWPPAAAGPAHRIGPAGPASERLLEEGLQQSKQGDLVAARRSFEEVVSKGHLDAAPRAMLGLGRVARRQGDLQAARRHFEQAVASGHADVAPQAMYDLGRLAEEEEGDLSMARRHFEDAVASGHPQIAARSKGSLRLLARYATERSASRQAMTSRDDAVSHTGPAGPAGSAGSAEPAGPAGFSPPPSRAGAPSEKQADLSGILQAFAQDLANGRFRTSRRPR